MRFILLLLGVSICAPEVWANTNAPTSRYEREGQHGRPRTEEERQERQQKKYQFMEKTLSEMGLDEATRQKVHALQEKYRVLMKENSEKNHAARQKLTDLQDQDASEEAIEAAIVEISAIQADALRIIVRNKMEMERIVGKENFSKIMDSARKQYRSRRNDGRNDGPGLPPRPDQPPLPPTSSSSSSQKLPPLPN